MIPRADFSSSGAFDTLFTKHTSRESFLSVITGTFQIPVDSELQLYDGETRLPMADFIASAIDYTHTGNHDLTPETAEYDDQAGKATVHVHIGLLARVSGAAIPLRSNSLSVSSIAACRDKAVGISPHSSA